MRNNLIVYSYLEVTSTPKPAFSNIVIFRIKYVVKVKFARRLEFASEKVIG